MLKNPTLKQLGLSFIKNQTKLHPTFRKMSTGIGRSGLSDYSSFFTEVALARQPSAIRKLQPLLAIPGMISLGGGMPNPNSFPIESMSITLKDGKKLALDGNALDTALQYSPSPGIPELVKWMKEKQKLEHTPLLEDDAWDVAVFTGSQDGLAKTFDMLITKGDNVLVESPTYSGALASLKPLGCNLIGVPTDENGMNTQELQTLMNNWNVQEQGEKPKVIYTIPSGSNPTGASMSEERRHHLLKIASDHNLLIIEDDPYYYLQFDERLPSLFSLCTEGRVIRADSFSKIISAGLRMGFITAPKQVLDRLVLHQQASSMHASGLSQAALLAVLNEWGNEGFEKHVESVVDLMHTRREAFLEKAETHLSGRAQWFAPKAGMFLWIKLNNVEDTTELIDQKAKENKVLFVPGSVFMPNGEASPYVRAAFSYCSFEDMDEGLRRLAKILD